MQGMTSTAVASDAKKSVLFEAHSAPQPAPADKPAVSEKDDERDRAQKTLDNCKVLLLFSSVFHCYFIWFSEDYLQSCLGRRYWSRWGSRRSEWTTCWRGRAA